MLTFLLITRVVQRWFLNFGISHISEHPQKNDKILISFEKKPLFNITVLIVLIPKWFENWFDGWISLEIVVGEF